MGGIYVSILCFMHFKYVEFLYLSQQYLQVCLLE